MFPNLNAEQARRNLTDERLAEMIGMNRGTFNRKKQNQRCIVDECLKLCKVLNCSFEYLFATNDQRSA